MRIFEEILFFKATYNTKINKTIHLSFASWILAEGRVHETYICRVFILLPPSASITLAKDK